MNCRPGDLAVIVRSKYTPQAVGRIVTCVRLKPCPRTGAPAWIIDPPVRGSYEDPAGCPRSGGWFYDECLSPIRDNDGEDETLRIAGKPEPQKLTEAA